MRYLAPTLTTLALLLITPGLALGGPSESLAKTARKAHKACMLGDYQTGASLLADLYLETKNATYLYNQGRCYEQNSRWEEALNRFLEYRRKAGGSDEDVNKHIADCEAMIEKARVAEPPTAPAPDVAPTTGPDAVAPPKDDLDEAPPTVSRSQPGRALKTAGLVCVGVGLVGIGAGVGLQLKANQIAAKPEINTDTSIHASWETYRTSSMISYGLGAAGVATGVILYLIGHNADSKTTIALFPDPSTGGWSGAIAGRF